MKDMKLTHENLAYTKFCSSIFVKSGAPGTIRTCDRLVRSQVLYPAELRALNLHFNFSLIHWVVRPARFERATA